MDQHKLRQLWRRYWRSNHSQPDETDLALPFQELRCGAKTRQGTPCRSKVLYSCGRCKLHGGKSTGPTSAAGKAQSRINGSRGGRPRKPKPMRT